MMRILYLTDSLMAAGIESQLVELVTRLDRTRFEPYVLCLYGPTSRNLHFAPRIRAAGIGLSTPDLGSSAWDKVKGIASIASTARAVRPQIIQAEGYHANLLMRLAFPFLPPARLIGTVRGIHSPKQLLYERLGQSVCERIVVNAAHVKTMLERHAGIPPSKVLHIPNGITLQRFAQPHDGSLRRRIAPQARRVFVSLGRISFEKNMHQIA
jgi:glycosyltransferase involved in cell wall biosynthesis